METREYYLTQTDLQEKADRIRRKLSESVPLVEWSVEIIPQAMFVITGTVTINNHRVKSKLLIVVDASEDMDRIQYTFSHALADEIMNWKPG